MGWLEGILSGYADQQHATQQENLVKAEADAQREAAIYKTLLGHEDPAIRHMAATGILQMGEGRKLKSGFAGWMGEMRKAPVYPELAKYFATPQWKDVPSQPGVSQTGGAIPQPPGSAALPAQSATQGGATTPVQPPPAPPQFSYTPGADANAPETRALAVGNFGLTPEATPSMPSQQFPGLMVPPPEPPPDMALTPDDRGGLAATAPEVSVSAEMPPWGKQAPPTPGTPAPQQELAYPRYPTEEEVAAQNKGRGDFNALVDVARRANIPNPEQWAANLIAERAKTGAYSVVQGETVMPDGTVVPMTAMKTPGGQLQDLQGNILTNFRPRTSLDYGDDIEAAAQDLFHVRFSEVPNESKAAVIKHANDLRAGASFSRTAATRQARAEMLPAEAMSLAQRLIPNATLQDQAWLADSLMRSTQNAVTTPATAAGAPAIAPAAAPAAAPAQAPAPAAPPSPAPLGPAPPETLPPPVAVAPAAASAAPAAASAAPAAASAATTGAPASKFVNGEWVLVPPTAAAAAAPATQVGTLPPMAPVPSHSTGTFGGDLIANLPAGGGDLSKLTGRPMEPTLRRLVAQAEATNGLVDRALLALEPHKNDNTLESSLRLTQLYRQGIFDPLDSAATQLADLAGLQASSNTQLSGGGSRALQFMMARRLHTPLLPSARQVSFYRAHVPVGIIAGASQMIKSDEGTFDTPALMYAKLLQIKANNQLFVTELQKTPIPFPGMGAPNVGQPPPTLRP